MGHVPAPVGDDTRRATVRRRLLVAAVLAAVAVAFADSSIVALALPELYGAFNTSIVRVSWVITAYNLVVAVAAFALAPFVGRIDAGRLSRAGLALFFAGSVGSAASWTLPALIAFRCVQGIGAAMLLAGALALLSALTGSAARGAALWTAAGTFGAAVGPALGGLLTQLFEWRAIFVFQAPVALLALVAAFESHLHPGEDGEPARGSATANLALGLLFGALVGALFLGVLLVITVWGLSPIAGALVVSALPLGTLAVRVLEPAFTARAAAGAGALLLAAGLAGLALLPRTSDAIVAVSLALCGAGIGLAVPVLSRTAIRPGASIVREGAFTIGARHAGLVAALALVAPLLSHDLDRGGQNALLAGTRVILDGNVPLREKVPIALDLRTALERAQKGTVPDLSLPFDSRGAAHDASLRQVRDSLIGALEGALTRSFRVAFALSAAFALLALLPIAARRTAR